MPTSTLLPTIILLIQLFYLLFNYTIILLIHHPFLSSTQTGPSLGWPGAHHTTQPGLELEAILLSLDARVLGLLAWIATVSLPRVSKTLVVL